MILRPGSTWRRLGRPPADGMLSGLALSADGAMVAATVVSPDHKADVDRVSAWVRGTEPTVAGWERFGPANGLVALAFTPQGTAVLGFTPAGAGLGRALVVCDVGSNDLHHLTEPVLPGGRAAWDSDGRRIAYTAAPMPGAADVHRARTLGYDLEGRGWLAENIQQVGITLGDASAEPRTESLTRSPADCHDVTWSPDGKAVGYVSSRHEDRFRDFGAQVLLLDVESRIERPVTTPDLVPFAPAFTPDGALLVAALTGPEGAGRAGALFLVDPRDGSRAALTDVETCEIAHPLTSSVAGVFTVADLAVTLRLARGAVQPIAVDPVRSGTWWDLLEGPLQTTAVGASAGGVVVLARSARGPGEVLFRPVDEVTRRPPRPHQGPPAPPVTAPALVDDTVSVRPLAATAADGETIDGWLVTPAAADGPLPLVVWLHGGPMAQVGWVLPPDVQAVVECGFAGLYVNPRGSAGRGEAFARAVVGRLAELDAGDVSAILDAALSLPEVDQDRVGVHGVSYGGYLAAMMWGRASVFKAAVVERAITAWGVHRATSDMGVAFTDAYWRGGPPPEARPDPLNTPSVNRSPVLVLAAEQDRRCPLTEAQLLFAKLVEEGVPAELAVLPGVGHYVAAAPPSVRRRRTQLLVDWWSLHLAPASPDGDAT